MRAVIDNGNSRTNVGKHTKRPIPFPRIIPRPVKLRKVLKHIVAVYQFHKQSALQHLIVLSFISAHSNYIFDAISK